MKKILIVLIAMLFITQIVKAQNLFFYGEQSFSCTKAISLKANSGDQSKDLNVLFAKYGEEALFIVNTEVEKLLIRHKLIIYLNDGTVIGLDDKGYYDYVDNTAITLYTLNKEDLIKLKNSNIHTIRFRLEGENDFVTNYYGGGSFTASNKGYIYDFPGLITALLEDTKDTVEYRVDAEITLQQLVEVERKRQEEADRIAKAEAERKQREEQQRKINEINSRTQGTFSNSGSGNQGFGVSFGLAGRSALSMPKPRYPGNDAGVVVVKVTVDKNGKVTNAEPGARGTTIMNPTFWNEAKQAALKARFNVSETAPAFQQGTISYRFVLD